MMNHNKLWRIARIVLGILLFVFAIELLKGSTGAIVPQLDNFLGFMDNPANALGFGWLASYAMMSGYPVTVLALTLFDSAIITPSLAFFMINGSRLGASLIIILIGVVETFKNKDSDIIDNTSIGFLTLIITYTIVIPAILLGKLFIDTDLIHTTFNLNFLAIIDNIYSLPVNFAISILGPLLSIISSLIILYYSLTIFEKPLREIKLENFKSSWINFLMERTHFSYIFGAALTLLSQSVALSIGIMVPLYINGFVQRRNLIPYIMGACVTTFGGTILAAIILRSSIAINISLTIMLANFIVSIFYLSFYSKYYKTITATTNFFLADRNRLVLLTILIFIIPFILIVL